MRAGGVNGVQSTKVHSTGGNQLSTLSFLEGLCLLLDANAAAATSNTAAAAAATTTTAAAAAAAATATCRQAHKHQPVAGHNPRQHQPYCVFKL